MAKAMITLTWCDWHLSEKDEEVPADAMPEWADGWGVDLCADCAAPYLEARALAERFGAKGNRTPSMQTRPVPRRPDQSADGPFPCPAEGCGSVLATKASLGAHARQMHGMPLGQLVGAPLDHVCPECQQGFTTPQGLAAHRRARHGVSGAAA